jgi:orotate phosphoribosyltransferase
MESGYHAEAWHDLDRVFEQPEKLRPFIVELARRLAEHGVDGICGPMVGGARLAREIAAELGVAAFVMERREDPTATGLFPVRYTLMTEACKEVVARRVAIVDDAISAGSAVRGSYANLRECGAQPVALGALFIFGGAAQAFADDNGLALEGIARLDFNLWKPEECPLCRAGVPVEKVSDADGLRAQGAG